MIKTLKKILTIALTTLSLFVAFSLVQSNTRASDFWSTHERHATTAVPLKLVFFGHNSDNAPYRILSKSDLKSIGHEDTTVSANTRVAISRTPDFKRGKNSYYSVRFISKKYASVKYSGDRGLFPCLLINNLNQLKNIKAIKLDIEN